MSQTYLVLLPVDGSKHSDRAFDFYLQFIHRPEYTVGILHVNEASSSTIIRIPLGSDITEEAIENIVRAQWKKVDDLIDKYKKKCEQAQCSVFIETKGKPGEVICRVAKEKNASLVVMGSRGLGTIRRTILGSVSQYVIDHAHIPVTVVPP
ncbi:universal stress protein Slr1101-like [Montipora foliosa]|uniref:universal stress protein Slr1101-like n=1 Tax=Montipora foliosa TaxID=591990 RepID=UPI0035F10079